MRLRNSINYILIVLFAFLTQQCINKKLIANNINMYKYYEFKNDKIPDLLYFIKNLKYKDSMRIDDQKKQIIFIFNEIEGMSRNKTYKLNVLSSYKNPLFNGYDYLLGNKKFKGSLLYKGHNIYLFGDIDDFFISTDKSIKESDLLFLNKKKEKIILNKDNSTIPMVEAYGCSVWVTEFYIEPAIATSTNITAYCD